MSVAVRQLSWTNVFPEIKLFSNFSYIAIRIHFTADQRDRKPRVCFRAAESSDVSQ